MKTLIAALLVLVSFQVPAETIYESLSPGKNYNIPNRNRPLYEKRGDVLYDINRYTKEVSKYPSKVILNGKMYDTIPGTDTPKYSTGQRWIPQ
jgi:hypothetical protein